MADEKRQEEQAGAAGGGKGAGTGLVLGALFGVVLSVAFGLITLGILMPAGKGGEAGKEKEAEWTTVELRLTGEGESLAFNVAGTNMMSSGLAVCKFYYRTRDAGQVAKRLEKERILLEDLKAALRHYLSSVDIKDFEGGENQRRHEEKARQMTQEILFPPSGPGAPDKNGPPDPFVERFYFDKLLVQK